MKLFVDTADVAEIKRLNDCGILDGVTTNPSLVLKANKNFKEVILEICRIVDGPISAETISTDFEGMILPCLLHGLHMATQEYRSITNEAKSVIPGTATFFVNRPLNE